MPEAGAVEQGAGQGPVGQACRRRVLIVDDEEANVLVLQEYLAQAYEIDVAYDGESALEKVRDCAPDLVLLDMMLPDIDGLLVCELLMNDGTTRVTPIVVPTNLDGTQDWNHRLDTAADDFHATPRDGLEMHSRLNHLVRLNDLMGDRMKADRRPETERERRGLMRDVIYAASGGKLVLTDERALDRARAEAVLCSRLEIVTPADVGEARALTEQVLRDMHMDGERIFDMVLCVSEASTNALTHAHGGLLEVFEVGGRAQAWVTDQGSGIDFSLLPPSTLMKGWSSKTSLGCGFTILLELLDLVVLSTSRSGTAVVMEMALDQQGIVDGCVAKPFPGHNPSSWAKNLMAVS